MNVKWDNDVRLWNSCTCGRGGFVRVRNRSCAASLAFVRTSGFSRAHENWVSCLVYLVIGWSSALEHGKPAALTVIG